MMTFIILFTVAVVSVSGIAMEVRATTIYSNATELDYDLAVNPDGTCDPDGYCGGQLPSGEFPSEVYEKTVRSYVKMGDIMKGCGITTLEAGTHETIPMCVTLLQDFNQRMTDFFLNNTDTVETILYG